MNKIIIALILGVFILSIGFTSAGFDKDDYIMKWQLCNALNFSEAVCDGWWEGAVDSPEPIINSTDITNWTEVDRRIVSAISNLTNASVLKADYYNKSEIDSSNFSGADFDIAYWTNEDRGKGNRLITEYDLQDYLKEFNPQIATQGVGGGLLGLLIGTLLLGICAFFYLINKDKILQTINNKKHRPMAREMPTFPEKKRKQEVKKEKPELNHPKIETRPKHLPKQDDIDKAEGKSKISKDKVEEDKE